MVVSVRAACLLFGVASLVSVPAAWADLVVTDAWVRHAPASAYMRAAYGALTNNGASPLTITDVRSPDFERSEVHETEFKNGMMTMSRVEHVVVPAGGRFEFNPNGAHIMLIAPKRALRKGDKIELEWVLLGGKIVKSVAEVRDAP